jgi:hypothetical protein
MSLRDVVFAILTDPERKSLYSGSQLVEMVRARGVELPADHREAWGLVSQVRCEIEMELYRQKWAMQTQGVNKDERHLLSDD